MQKLFIVGDVHGCYKTLLALLRKMPAGYEPVFLGDLIDRGPRSSDVVEFVRTGKYRCVKGNHEDMFLQSIVQKDRTITGRRQADNMRDNWKINGGNETIESFGGYIPSVFVDWFSGLPNFIQFGQLLVSHTGHGLDDNEHFALWGRSNDFPNDGLFRVFGHTPKSSPIKTDSFVNIDTGCVFKELQEFGKLTAMTWPEKEFFQQENCE